MNKKVTLSLLSATVFASMAASAFAAPTQGVYMGGSVDKFYKLDDLFNLSAAAKKQFVVDLNAANPDLDFKNLVFVDFDGKGAKFSEILAAGTLPKAKRDLTKADFEGSYVTVNLDGSNGVSYDPRNDAVDVPTGDLKVESVSAINAKQIQVKFNNAVDEDTALDVTNYSIKLAGASAVAMATSGNNKATAELSEDGKTVTLTLTNALTTTYWGSIADGDVFQVIVDGVKDSAGHELAETVKTVTYTDKEAPTFVSATATAKTTTNKVTLSFSEPIDYSQATVTVNGVAASLSAGTKANEVVVTSGSNLNAGSSYELKLLNFKDAAGNLLTPNPVVTSVTVQADVTAPVVTGVSVVRDSLIEVTFDKSMDPATVNSTSVKLLNTDLATTGITQGTIQPKPNTSNKTFLVPFTAIPFNSNGTFTGVLSFTSAIKDAAGNAFTAKTESVTLTKDTVAPEVVSATYTNKTSYNGVTTTNGAIIVKFNEKIAASAAANTYVVVNDQGAPVSTPIASTAVNPNDATELILVLNAGVATGTKTYTVVMPASAATDLSVSQNASASVHLTVDVSAGGPVANDPTAPVVNTVTPTAATSSTSGTTIAVAFTEAGSGLDPATIQDLNNYRLDGAPLPSGSYVTLSGTTATINIPAGKFAEDKAYAFNINGIKDKAGNVMNPYVGSVNLKDDIKPELTSATLNSNGTVSLGFSEKVNAASGKEADFAVTVNGSLLTGTNKAYTLADGVGSDAGKYVLTVKLATIGKAATAGSYTDPNGGTWTTAGATNVVKFTFVDVDGNQDLSAGDIILTGTDTGATTAIAFSDNAAYDLNNALSVKVGTIASPSLVTDTSNLTNVVKGSKTITVK
ncbi:S-layer protein [Brevibacillus agri]|uniref:S-layer homology domain-containing protein n=1 Tax=Brevibacillus agri TaxID=51101 RepID=A0A3M8AX83_9BACL|nr:Ig-like domain-containing protein [Brevibacillus agri]QAV12215.1 hypothetical protein BA6348_05195 [Brevibacillus agri]RNB55603.1 S-layer homology domain-containing protein [Brevibacillus agri]GED26445.1 S-layer protein [Brevibacillus agri]